MHRCARECCYSTNDRAHTPDLCTHTHMKASLRINDPDHAPHTYMHAWPYKSDSTSLSSVHPHTYKHTYINAHTNIHASSPSNDCEHRLVRAHKRRQQKRQANSLFLHAHIHMHEWARKKESEHTICCEVWAYTPDWCTHIRTYTLKASPRRNHCGHTPDCCKGTLAYEIITSQKQQ